MFGERERREAKGRKEGWVMRVLEVEEQQRQAGAAMLFSQASTPLSDAPRVSGASGFLQAF